MRPLAVFLLFFTLSFAHADENLAPSQIARWVYGNENKETVVLVHGFNSSHLTWPEGMIQALSQSYRVVIYDQPGHGDTPEAGKDYSPEVLAKDLKALLDSMGIPKAHILGHSMGGRVAVRFATSYPESISSVCVEDMHLMLVQEAKDQLPGVLAKYDEVRKNVPSQFATLADAWKSLSRYYSVKEIPLILAVMQKKPDGTYRLGNRPEATNLYLAQGLAEEMTNLLKEIKVPLTFFAGSDQFAVLKKDGIDSIHAVRPDVSISVIPNSSHSVHQIPQMWQEYEAFLSKSRFTGKAELPRHQSEEPVHQSTVR